MAFVKVQKNNTYYKRFQVKFRRRRQGKTDYYQRKRLTTQRKNKYNTPKWRFVVRRTNQRIICQVVWSTITNDKVKTSADSLELKRFGLTAGLTNYAAAYCTGLLCARRLLTVLDQENDERFKRLGLEGKSEMSKTFNFVTEATGEYINNQELAEKKSVQRPFTCFLDIGLVRATCGNRVFAAMKGAVDGGLHIPHSDKIFPKVKTDAKGAKGAKDTKAPAGNPLRDRIYGVHVQNYLEKLRKTPNQDNPQQFTQVEKMLTDNKVKTLEELYKKVHAAIRANPARVKKAPRPVKHTADPKNPNLRNGGLKTYRRDVRLNREQRRVRVEQKIAKYLKERKK